MRPHRTPRRTTVWALALAAAIGAGPSFATQAQEIEPAPAEDAAEDAAPTGDAPSPAAAAVIDWVVVTHDNGEQPFVVVDKTAAELFVFDFSGRELARAAVLVGIAKGDDSAPGVGDKDLQAIPVSERTTPAGRFVATFGPAAGHRDMLWVDWPNAISLHPVITTNPKERRLARLTSPTAADNRITYGCINVASATYSKVIEPLFRPAGGIVYILPEVRPLQEIFAGLPPESPEATTSFAEVFADFSRP